MTSHGEPNQSDFRRKILLVAVAFIVLGIILYFIASAVLGGIIVLLGAVFALGDKVYRDLPKK